MTAELVTEYKIFDEYGGYTLVRQSADCPGMTEIIYVNAGDDPANVRYMAIGVDHLKQLIRALERRLPEAIAEEAP